MPDKEQNGVASKEWEERTLFLPYSLDLTTNASINQRIDPGLPVGFWLFGGEPSTALFRSGVAYVYVGITGV